MVIEEDFNKLKDDPTFQRLAAHLRSAPTEVVEDLLARCGNTAANLDVPLSRMVETAVWQFYHKPALSFQKELDDDTEK